MGVAEGKKATRTILCTTELLSVFVSDSAAVLQKMASNKPLIMLKINYGSAEGGQWEKCRNQLQGPGESDRNVFFIVLCGKQEKLSNY